MNSTIQRNLSYFDRAYAVCINMLIKAKDETTKEARRKDSLYWLSERENFLSKAKTILTDEDYIKLTIY